MSQGTRDLRKKAPHCVPLSAKGEEGQPPGLGPAHCYRGGTSGSFWKYNDPLPSQDHLGSLLALKALRGLAPPSPDSSELPTFPSPQVQPPRWGPDCISLWGAALASACLATSSGRQDYFLLPPLPLHMSVGVFQPIFNQR